MSRSKVRLAALPVAAGAILALTAFGLQSAANASPTTVSATTAITNHPDGGHPNVWAYDDFNRTLTVAVDATQTSCTGSPAGYDPTTDTCYTASVTDSGEFHAILGVLAPNQSTAGVKIGHAVGGNMNGNGGYNLYAPTTDTLTGTVETTQDDNFTDPTATDHTSSDWPAQAFANPTAVQVSENTYSYTYKSACETWVDSGTNGDGNLSGDGNITGANTCVVFASGQVLFQNVNSGKCLNVLNGKYVVGGTLNQYTCNAMWAGEPGGAQRFQYYVLANGERFLEAVSPGGSTLYVQATVKGAPLSLTTTPVPYAAYTGGYVSWYAGGMRLYMDVQNYSKVNLATVHGWTLNSPATTNQQWNTRTPA